MYDEEYMVQDLKDIFTANLNDEIACINTEKGANPGDDFYIESINSDKFLPTTMGIKQLLNYTGFWVSYGISDTPIKAQQTSNYIEDLTVTFEVATFDNGIKDPEILFIKFLRYRKALKNVIMKNPDVFRGYGQPLVGSLKPAAFPYSSKKVILSIGIDIKASITAY
jgi:hypothetical protein